VNEPRVDCAALAAVYGQGADSYDALWSPVIMPPALAVIDALELADATRVMDVGAGTGALTDPLRAAAPDASVVSADAAPEMLRYARDHRRALAVLADAAALPFATSSIDAVLVAYVLFHVLEPRTAVSEAARVLRRGGRVGTVTWANESTSRAATVWTDALDELGVPTLPAHGNYAGLDSEDAINTLLDTASLRPIRTWRHRVERTFTADAFWKMRTGCGCRRARLAALDDHGRDQILPELRRRLEQLQPTDYEFRGEVICSVSEKIR
jgi:ubiquinone/menaquinone biosynthesis C-methylase UbiE